MCEGCGWVGWGCCVAGEMDGKEIVVVFVGVVGWIGV